mgnify:CR=1 FL=1
MHVVFKAATNPECVTLLTLLTPVHCAATAVSVATLIVVVGILAVPAALLRFKMRVSWNTTNQGQSP